jgi:hypothetical protein
MAGAAQAGRPLAAAGGPVRGQLRRRERCPECGAPSQRGQLVCLGCGERLALEPKRPQAARPGVIAAALLVLVGGISTVFVADALLGDRSGPERVAAQVPAEPPGPALARARADTTRRALNERARRQIAQAAPRWPATQAGWTVVLLGSADRVSAERFAASLKSSGVEAGILSPEQRPDLGTLWTVFSGVYGDQAAAVAATAELRLRYPGAFTRYVPTAPTSAAAAPPPPG